MHPPPIIEKNQKGVVTLKNLFCKNLALIPPCDIMYIEVVTMYKKIKTKEGLDNYEINEHGVIRNAITKKEIATQDHNGYKVVHLSKGGKNYKKRVHVLVADTFLNKKDFKSLPSENRDKVDLDTLEVNHIDLNKANNELSNLEWCTSTYNRWHAYVNSPNYCEKKRVIGINVETRELKVFDSLYMAGKYLSLWKKDINESDIKHKSTSIKGVCDKKSKTFYNYYWFWYDEDIINNPDEYVEEIAKPKKKYTDEQEEWIAKNELSMETIRFRMKKYGLSFDEAIKLPKGTRLKPIPKWSYEPNKNTKLYEGLNKKFGRLTPVEIIKEKGKKSKYRCICDCGGEITTQYTNLFIGKTKSCGCLK